MIIKSEQETMEAVMRFIAVESPMVSPAEQLETESTLGTIVPQNKSCQRECWPFEFDSSVVYPLALAAEIVDSDGTYARKKIGELAY